MAIEPGAHFLENLLIAGRSLPMSAFRSRRLGALRQALHGFLHPEFGFFFQRGECDVHPMSIIGDAHFALRRDLHSVQVQDQLHAGVTRKGKLGSQVAAAQADVLKSSRNGRGALVGPVLHAALAVEARNRAPVLFIFCELWLPGVDVRSGVDLVFDRGNSLFGFQSAQANLTGARSARLADPHYLEADAVFLMLKHQLLSPPCGECFQTTDAHAFCAKVQSADDVTKTVTLCVDSRYAHWHCKKAPFLRPSRHTVT